MRTKHTNPSLAARTHARTQCARTSEEGSACLRAGHPSPFHSLTQPSAGGSPSGAKSSSPTSSEGSTSSAASLALRLHPALSDERSASRRKTPCCGAVRSRSRSRSRCGSCWSMANAAVCAPLLWWLWCWWSCAPLLWWWVLAPALNVPGAADVHSSWRALMWLCRDSDAAWSTASGVDEPVWGWRSKAEKEAAGGHTQGVSGRRPAARSTVWLRG